MRVSLEQAKDEVMEIGLKGVSFEGWFYYHYDGRTFRMRNRDLVHVVAQALSCDYSVDISMLYDYSREVSGIPEKAFRKPVPRVKIADIIKEMVGKGFRFYGCKIDGTRYFYVRKGAKELLNPLTTAQVKSMYLELGTDWSSTKVATFLQDDSCWVDATMPWPYERDDDIEIYDMIDIEHEYLERDEWGEILHNVDDPAEFDFNIADLL